MKEGIGMKRIMKVLPWALLCFSIIGNIVVAMMYSKAAEKDVNIRGFYQYFKDGYVCSATIDDEEQTYYILKQYPTYDEKGDKLEEGKILKTDNGGILLESNDGIKRFVFIDDKGFTFYDEEENQIRFLERKGDVPTYLFERSSRCNPPNIVEKGTEL